MAKPFIDAWKSGADKPTITEDKIVYWYRVAPRDLNCDSTDTTMEPANNASGNYFMGRPNGYETAQDAVFVVPLLTSPGTIIVNSGGKEYVFNAPAGASAFEAPMGIGSQYFALQRNGNNVMSSTSLREIKNECPCGYGISSSLLAAGRLTLCFAGFTISTSMLALFPMDLAMFWALMDSPTFRKA